MIAAFVSTRHGCYFRQTSHRAAAHYLQGNYALVDAVRWDYQNAPVTPKLKSPLAVTARVKRGGKKVTEEDIALAREAGATDLELHDTMKGYLRHRG
jgi:hypothetical protein